MAAHLLGGAGLGDGERHAEDGVGAELGLVLGAVELQEEVVDRLLVGHVQVLGDQRRRDDLVDVLHGLAHA